MEHEKTKESFSDGKKEGNGGVTNQNNDSNLSKQPEKTKESFSDGAKDVNSVTKQNNDSNLSKQPEKTKEASSSKIKGHHQTRGDKK